MKARVETTIEHVPVPNLLARIAELHKEIDVLVENYVLANTNPGVPAAAVKACMLTGRVGHCRCAQAKLITETATEKEEA